MALRKVEELVGRIADLESELESVRKVERDFRHTKTRYKALLDYMLNGVVIYRPSARVEDFVVVDLNKAAEKIEKIKAIEVLGKSISQVFPRIQEFGLLEVLRKVARTGKPIDHPVTKYKDKRLEGWRDYFVYKLPTGEIVTVYSDETKRKQAEEALRRSEERFRTVVESIPDCIFIKDTQCRFVYANPAMEALLGSKSSEIVGRSSENFFGEEAGKHIRESDLRALKGESIEEEHTRPVQGVNLTFHEIRVPLRNDEGEVMGICGISRDVTERTRLVGRSSIVVKPYPSEAMRETLSKASFAATTDSIILLLGESGSGKDFLARWIHNHSKRSDGPFFAINCAAIAPELAESELFGHEEGAFTGARRRKRGMLELAEGGTILLNEIGELSLSLQSKLLTFLDTKSFLRVGGEKSIRIDARIIAATHRDLAEEVQKGLFLEPLFYRLGVFPIQVPPLRERAADVPIIAQEIASQLASELQLANTPMFDAADLAALKRYHWPGNVRELRNVLERSIILSGKGPFRVWLSFAEQSSKDWSFEVKFPGEETLTEIKERVTEELCLEALQRTGGNQKRAARLLGISRDSMHRYARKFGFKREHLTRFKA